jgi:hypothetical protein
MTDRPAGERPLLRVVRGEPTAEELAAVVAVLAVRSRPAAVAGPEPPAAGGWADRTAALRRPLAPGPGAWRVAGRTPGVRTGAG